WSESVLLPLRNPSSVLSSGTADTGRDRIGSKRSFSSWRGVTRSPDQSERYCFTSLFQLTFAIMQKFSGRNSPNGQQGNFNESAGNRRWRFSGRSPGTPTGSGRLSGEQFFAWSLPLA